MRSHAPTVADQQRVRTGGTKNPKQNSGQRNCCQNPSVNRRPFALAANGQSRSCLSLLLYWVANCGVQDTLITQPFNCRGRSSESITNLISQQGGLICRSIVNDTNAEGRLY